MKTMEEDCKNEKYEQFDTMDIEEEKDVRDNVKIKINLLFPQTKLLNCFYYLLLFFAYYLLYITF